MTYREQERIEWAMCFREGDNFVPHWYLWDVIADMFTSF